MFATDIYGPAEQPPTLDRWTIDLDAGKVIEERLDDRPQEFPRVDDRVVGRRHRYGYATQRRSRRRRGPLRRPAEARPRSRHHRTRASVRPARRRRRVRAGGGRRRRGRGLAARVVYDEASDASDLLVLDATDFTGPSHRQLPQRVPFGFHGSWVGDGPA